MTDHLRTHPKSHAQKASTALYPDESLQKSVAFSVGIERSSPHSLEEKEDPKQILHSLTENWDLQQKQIQLELSLFDLTRVDIRE